MSDLLRLEYINALPQPFIASLSGGGDWEVSDIEVGSGLLRINVSGKLQVIHMPEVNYFTDAEGNRHDPDTFYCDYEPPEQSS